jgi:hypothetical protein
MREAATQAGGVTDRPFQSDLAPTLPGTISLGILERYKWRSKGLMGSGFAYPTGRR